MAAQEHRNSTRPRSPSRRSRRHTGSPSRSRRRYHSPSRSPRRHHNSSRSPRRYHSPSGSPTRHLISSRSPARHPSLSRSPTRHHGPPKRDSSSTGRRAVKGEAAGCSRSIDVLKRMAIAGQEGNTSRPKGWVSLMSRAQTAEQVRESGSVNATLQDVLTRKAYITDEDVVKMPEKDTSDKTSKPKGWASLMSRAQTVEQARGSGSANTTLQDVLTRKAYMTDEDVVKMPEKDTSVRSRSINVLKRMPIAGQEDKTSKPRGWASLMSRAQTAEQARGSGSANTTLQDVLTRKTYKTDEDVVKTPEKDTKSGLFGGFKGLLSVMGADEREEKKPADLETDVSGFVGGVKGSVLNLMGTDEKKEKLQTGGGGDDGDNQEQNKIELKDRHLQA
ncbi:serine/arginine-rich splicing factor 4-like [Branchiostoma lanceolatum]|uniref:serine/arginine-rich splicing factor 4-like n=1 Tax=Branchiostoma lanceolatum TaxID=7740 RepID=UPI003452571F